MLFLADKIVMQHSPAINLSLISLVYNRTMASNIYEINGVKYRRGTKQGGKSAGLSRWTGRLTTSSLEIIRTEAKRLHPYYTVNDFIRVAVDKYVRTELVKL